MSKLSLIGSDPKSLNPTSGPPRFRCQSADCAYNDAGHPAQELYLKVLTLDEYGWYCVACMEAMMYEGKWDVTFEHALAREYGEPMPTARPQPHPRSIRSAS